MTDDQLNKLSELLSKKIIEMEENLTLYGTSFLLIENKDDDITLEVIDPRDVYKDKDET